MRIIALGGSNSKNSINRRLAAYTAGLFANADVEVIDLTHYEMPLFSVDLEKEIPTPQHVFTLLEKFERADLLVVSLAENNASYNAGFKNIFDWISRTNPKQWQGKPMLLMATSPGARGGASVLETAAAAFPRYGANILATFSLPKFQEAFSAAEGIIDLDKKDELLKIVALCSEQL